MTNYEASISAGLTQPLLTGAAPRVITSAKVIPVFLVVFVPGTKVNPKQGGSYCNASSSNCLSCGNYPEWCVCNSGNWRGALLSELNTPGYIHQALVKNAFFFTRCSIDIFAIFVLDSLNLKIA